jgi:hypothetical protein
MAKSRLSMRREVEAAEAAEETTPSTKKKAAKKKATRKKAVTTRARKAKEVAPRRRLVWVVYSSTMREEGRFLYHERDKADTKLEQLLARGKRRYFIQPIKEPLDSEGQPMKDDDEDTAKTAAKKTTKKKATAKVEATEETPVAAEAGEHGDADAKE